MNQGIGLKNRNPWLGNALTVRKEFFFQFFPQYSFIVYTTANKYVSSTNPHKSEEDNGHTIMSA